jgi:hypothetical protein
MTIGYAVSATITEVEQHVHSRGLLASPFFARAVVATPPAPL